MNYSIVIPAHNEAQYIETCLNSIVYQTILPKQLVIVNDHSTDQTKELIQPYLEKYNFISLRNRISNEDHLPGSKVVAAFNDGLSEIDLTKVDLLVKLDADLILPTNYFEEVINCFKKNDQLGIAGGFAYEEDENGQWKLNHSMNKDHVRGAFKTYHKACFSAMGGLKIAMGWDTADELLAQYHGYTIKTLEHLKVKHLRPLGNAYNKKAKLLQGKAMYGLRYGFLITLIAGFKMSVNQQKIQILFDIIRGYFKALNEKAPFIVSKNEGAFIRKLRWKGILNKLTP